MGGIVAKQRIRRQETLRQRQALTQAKQHKHRQPPPPPPPEPIEEDEDDEKQVAKQEDAPVVPQSPSQKAPNSTAPEPQPEPPQDTKPSQSVPEATESIDQTQIQPEPPNQSQNLAPSQPQSADENVSQPEPAAPDIPKQEQNPPAAADQQNTAQVSSAPPPAEAVPSASDDVSAPSSSVVSSSSVPSDSSSAALPIAMFPQGFQVTVIETNPEPDFSNQQSQSSAPAASSLLSPASQSAKQPASSSGSPTQKPPSLKEAEVKATLQRSGTALPASSPTSQTGSTAAVAKTPKAPPRPAQDRKYESLSHSEAVKLLVRQDAIIQQLTQANDSMKGENFVSQTTTAQVQSELVEASQTIATLKAENEKLKAALDERRMQEERSETLQILRYFTESLENPNQINEKLPQSVVAQLSSTLDSESANTLSAPSSASSDSSVADSIRRFDVSRSQFYSQLASHVSDLLAAKDGRLLELNESIESRRLAEAERAEMIKNRDELFLKIAELERKLAENQEKIALTAMLQQKVLEYSAALNAEKSRNKREVEELKNSIKEKAKDINKLYGLFKWFLVSMFVKRFRLHRGLEELHSRISEILMTLVEKQQLEQLNGPSQGNEVAIRKSLVAIRRRKAEYIQQLFHPSQQSSTALSFAAFLANSSPQSVISQAMSAGSAPGAGSSKDDSSAFSPWPNTFHLLKSVEDEFGQLEEPFNQLHQACSHWKSTSDALAKRVIELTQEIAVERRSHAETNGELQSAVARLDQREQDFLAHQRKHLDTVEKLHSLRLELQRLHEAASTSGSSGPLASSSPAVSDSPSDGELEFLANRKKLLSFQIFQLQQQYLDLVEKLEAKRQQFNGLGSDQEQPQLSVTLPPSHSAGVHLPPLTDRPRQPPRSDRAPRSRARSASPEADPLPPLSSRPAWDGDDSVEWQKLIDARKPRDHLEPRKPSRPAIAPAYLTSPNSKAVTASLLKEKRKLQNKYRDYIKAEERKRKPNNQHKSMKSNANEEDKGEMNEEKRMEQNKVNQANEAEEINQDTSEPQESKQHDTSIPEVDVHID